MPTRLSSRYRILVILGLTVGLGWTIVRAQQSSRPDELTQSVQELTRELRSLRGAVEASGQNQLQAQVLGLYATLQQQRVASAASRVDVVRRELEGTGARTGDLNEQVVSLESRIPQETNADRRRELERHYLSVKQELSRLAAQENRLKNREAELNQSAQTEEAQWRDLVSRLEQLMKK